MIALVLAAAVSGWSYRTLADPITDAKRGIATLQGEAGAVVFKCDGNGPNSLYLDIIPKAFLGIDTRLPRPVLVRIDGGPVRKVDMVYTDRDAVLTENGEAYGLARAMATAKRVTLRLTDFRGDNVDIDATADGNPAAVQEAITTCGQKDYSAAQLAPAVPHDITKPVWARQPSADDISQYYPDRAQRLDKGGFVTLSCTATASGTLTGCGVVSESPVNYDFGSAALKLTRMMRLAPRDGDGVSVEMGTVTFPLNFSTHPTPSPGR